jgi:hypothetical protein
MGTIFCHTVFSNELNVLKMFSMRLECELQEAEVVAAVVQWIFADSAE